MKKLLALIAVLALAFFAWPEKPESPQQAVSSVIHRAAEAARRAKPGDFMDEFSEGFEGTEMTRAKLKAFVTRRFLSRGGVAVRIGEVHVRIHPSEKEATASFQATFPTGIRGLSGEGDTRVFEVGLILENGHWKIRSQQNRPVSG